MGSSIHGVSRIYSVTDIIIISARVHSIIAAMEVHRSQNNLGAFIELKLYIYIYKGSGRGRLGAPRPPWRVRVECEEVFVLELSGTHELHTINTTYQVADVRPSGLR